MLIWQQLGLTLGKKFLGTTISRLLGSTPSTLAFLGRLFSALAFRLCFLGDAGIAPLLEGVSWKRGALACPTGWRCGVGLPA